MARIAGVDLPREKRVEIGLTYIYGIGPTRAKEICASANVDENSTCTCLLALPPYAQSNYLSQMAVKEMKK